MISEYYDYADIDASLPACRLYQHLGYQTVDHGIWECANGVIQVYEIMKKRLEKNMNHLENYYSNIDEDSRFLSNHGQVEYLTTMKYIYEVIGSGERKKILEVGAGTGRYSIALAKEGHQVDALEYTEHNFGILKSKIEGVSNVNAHHGNALDLSRFEDESFDVTLVLGPMYHIYTKEDKQKVLAEAIRVTKSKGHILVAYCMNEATVIRYAFLKGRIGDCVEKHMLTDDFKCISEEKDVFEMVRMEDIDELNAGFDEIERVKIISVDGAANYMCECIDAMDEKTFDMYMKYHLTVCERMDLIGATDHSLDILEKR